jgi:hypothetical protein
VTVELNHITERALPYGADPRAEQPGEIYRHHGGQGVHFQDPSGHLLEVPTQPSV